MLPPAQKKGREQALAGKACSRPGAVRLIPVAYNGSNVVNVNIGPRRMPYPSSEYTDNLQNVQQGVQMLGGPDNLATRMWWDCNPDRKSVV